METSVKKKRSRSWSESIYTTKTKWWFSFLDGPWEVYSNTDDLESDTWKWIQFYLIQEDALSNPLFIAEEICEHFSLPGTVHMLVFLGKKKS